MLCNIKDCFAHLLLVVIVYKKISPRTVATHLLSHKVWTRLHLQVAVVYNIRTVAKFNIFGNDDYLIHNNNSILSMVVVNCVSF